MHKSEAFIALQCYRVSLWVLIGVFICRISPPGRVQASFGRVAGEHRGAAAEHTEGESNPVLCDEFIDASDLQVSAHIRRIEAVEKDLKALRDSSATKEEISRVRGEMKKLYDGLHVGECEFGILGCRI